jgi:hypothetical protein
MDTATNPAVRRYLRDLEKALRDVPAARRREIVEEIRQHIEESASVSTEDGDLQLRTVLDQVGDPETIAEEAREGFGIAKPKAGALEGIAIALLLVGGIIIPAVGWVIGAVFLWVSGAWTLRDKLIGTFVLPGGLAFPAFLVLFAPTACTSVTEPDGIELSTCSTEPLSSELVLMIVVTLLPVFTAVYLARRAFRR